MAKDNCVVVFDHSLKKAYQMYDPLARNLSSKYPKRFTIYFRNPNLSTKKKGSNTMATNSKKSQSNFEQISGNKKGKGFAKSNLQNLIQIPRSVKLQDYVGSVVGIVRLEPIESDQYGNGYHVSIVTEVGQTIPDECGVFSVGVVPTLDALYEATDSGTNLSIEKPVYASVVAAGRSYRLE